MNLIEEYKILADLQMRLFHKYPEYVHLDITLSRDSGGTDEVQYNIYTPELSHNTYTDFNEFVDFIELVLRDGVKNIRIAILNSQLAQAIKQKEFYDDQIVTINGELEKVT